MGGGYNCSENHAFSRLNRELPSKTQRKKWMLCAAIIALQIIVILFWTNEKAGFHHDEILTFQLSNDLEQPEKLTISWKSDFLNQWHEAAYFQKVLAAQAGHTFDYAGVYEKQTHDVHPPMFYYGVHTMSSMFPGVFSKWLGIIPNIVYFVITQIAIYAIGKRICKSEWFSLLIVAAYGFSTVAISSVIFIRMYALMTMWAVLAVYCHLRIYEDWRKLRWYVLAGILTFMGMNTQYYFVIFQFFVSACCFLWLICSRHYKNALAYAVSILAGFGATILYWPSIIKHIFSGYRGTQAFDNLLDGNNRLSGFLLRIGNMMANGWTAAILFGLALLCALAFFCKRRNDTENNDVGRISLITMLVTVCGYILIVTRLAPYADIRYIMAVLPLLVICVLWAFWDVLIKLVQKPKIVSLVMAVFIFTITISTYNEGRVEYRFKGWKTEMDAVEQYRDLNAIVIADNTWKVAGTMVLHLSEHPQSFITKTEYIDELKYEMGNCVDGFVLYLEKGTQDGERLKEIETMTASVAELIFDRNGSFGIYYCNFNP